MGGENTKKSKEETLPEIRGWTRITMRGHTPHREEKREEGENEKKPAFGRLHRIILATIRSV